MIPVIAAIGHRNLAAGMAQHEHRLCAHLFERSVDIGFQRNPFSASKAFVSTWTRALARELAPDAIRVNAVSPGTIMTDFHRRYSSQEKLDKTAASIPLKRLGTAEDCAPAYVFLASSALSGYITGQILEINGGQFMG